MTPRTWKLLDGGRGLEQTFGDDGRTRLYILTDGTARIATEIAPANYITTLMVRQVHERRRLAAGEKATFINLFYGDVHGSRENYRVERRGPVDGVLFRRGEPVAYFGCGQCDEAKAILPVQARMFLLTGDRLALVDGTSAGDHFRSSIPVCREVKLPPEVAGGILDKLARK